MREIINDALHDNLFKERPLYAFNEAEDYFSWKKRIKEKYNEILRIDQIKKNACELKIEIEECVKKDGYTRYRYVFESEKGCFVPCYLLIPDGEKEKYPVCICLQGHTSGFHISIGEPKDEQDKKDVVSQDFGIEAVKHGFIALCIEQRGMGERQPKATNTRSNGCMFTAMTALILGRTLIGERVWDVSRAIDTLSYFEKADINDITCIGHSGGGTATYYSACYDERIKTAVSSCSICSYKDSIGGKYYHCTCNYLPDCAKYFDMGELACLIAPRKLILTAGVKDPIFDIKGIREIYQVVAKIYEKENAKGKCELIETDKEHYFSKDIVFNKIKK